MTEHSGRPEGSQAERPGVPEPQKVGILGLGRMGRGIAKNLLENGFTVQGFDIAKRARDELRDFGGVAVGSAAEAARGVRWLVLSLPGITEVELALSAAAAPGANGDGPSYVINTSTMLPQQAIDLSKRLAEDGIHYLDAPISGTGATILERNAVLLVGSTPASFAACRPVLDAFARASYHLGPVGAGATAKLLTNVVVVGNRLALAEALALGLKAGIDPEVLLETLKVGPAYSRAMDLKGEKMIRRDYRPESTLEQSLHGTELLLAEARRVGSPLFGAAVYSQVVQAAVAMGYGELDTAALLEALIRMGGPATRD